MEITVCGNFQAECSYDGQCAFNHCQGGFCTGPLFSSSSTSVASSTYAYYGANSTKTTKSIPVVTGTGNGTSVPGGAGPTTSVLYVNGTATASNTQVTSTLVVGGKTTLTGGETSFRQGPTQTASVQNGGTGRPVEAGVAGACALGMVGVAMLML